MYQFTTTTLINSSLDSNGTTAKYSGTATSFIVPRVNTFKAANIISVSKRSYRAGTKEVATITVPTLTANQVARLSLELRLEQSAYSEYANMHLYFEKPIVVEVLATGTAATDASALVSALDDLKNRFGYTYVTASVSDDEITITAKDNNQRIYALEIYEENSSDNSIIDPEYDLQATGEVTTDGVLGFGDDEWMIKSIRIPSLDNTKQYAIAADEKPIIGGNYTQYTIRYSVDLENMGVLSGGKSITNHVFYVTSDLVSDFEDALETTFPGITTIGGDGTIIISGDEVLDLSESETTTLTATNYSGTVTWTSGTPATATIDSSTGVVTAVAAGTTEITATDSDSNTGTFTITVVA